MLATLKRDELVFWTPCFLFLDSTLFRLDSTFWFDSTVQAQIIGLLCDIFTVALCISSRFNYNRVKHIILDLGRIRFVESET